MARTTKIDSNSTQLTIAEEQTLKTLPGTPVWNPQEPNGYTDFGGQFTLVSRNPINSSAQRKKGVITDLDSSGGFGTDITQTNLQDLLQGFFFADLRPKGEEDVTSITGGGTTNDYNVASTTGFQVNDLVFASGFANATNNGLKNVDTVTVDTLVSVTQTLVNDASPATGAKLVVVGHQGGAGDIDVDATGSFPALTSTTLDFTTLGLNVGEFIFIGGDTASLRFTNTVNNGFARVRTIAANRLEFDKTDGTMVTEASTTETIQLFFGRVIKNEQGALIKRRTYQLERDLGSGDDTFPTNQTEYIRGAVASELAMNLATADKLTADLTYVGVDTEIRDGSDSDGGATGQAPKSGTRPALVEADAFNTSSDFSRIRVAIHDDTDSNPTALFGFAQNIVLNVNNNISPNKAIGTLGAFEVTRGTFQVGGTINAYFGAVALQNAVKNNSDVTIDYAVVKSNAGFVVDVPLCALGDGRPNVEQDQPILVPLTFEAADASKIATTLNHTLMMVFFDYLPSLADT